MRKVIELIMSHNLNLVDIGACARRLFHVSCVCSMRIMRMILEGNVNHEYMQRTK